MNACGYCVLHRGWYISSPHYCYSYHYYMGINLVYYVWYMNLHDVLLHGIHLGTRQ